MEETEGTQASGSGRGRAPRRTVTEEDRVQLYREKRKLRQDYRALIGSTEEARNNLADHTPLQLSQMIRKGAELYEQVKEPAEGVLDSRFLLNASEVGAQMARNLKLKTGFEVDDYLSRVATLLGGALGPPGRNTATQYDDDELEEEEEAGNEQWDWQTLGRMAAKRSKRAPTMDFLLGPLAVEDKKRNVGKRAPVERSGPVVKPQQLNEEDIIKSENETTKLVREINDRLEEFNDKGGVNYFEFVIDPNSFSNSVENIFYLSFLVRDGRVSIDDVDGVPILTSVEMPTEEDYNQGLEKRQLIMEFDMATWRELIELYNITEPIIPSRVAQVNGDTWTARP